MLLLNIKPLILVYRSLFDFICGLSARNLLILSEAQLHEGKVLFCADF